MPGEDEKWHEYWKEARIKWWEEQGLKRENINIYTTPKEDLAHYAKACYDIEYQFPHGMEELEALPIAPIMTLATIPRRRRK